METDLDDFITGASGSAVGGAPSYSFGEVGSGLAFTGDGRHVDLGPQVFGTSDFSLAFWMSTAAAQQQTILGNRIDAATGNFFSVRMLADGTIDAELNQDGTNDVVLNGATPVNDGQYHQVTITRSGTTFSLYVDGVLDASGASAGVTDLTHTSPLLLGYEPADDLGVGVNAYDGSLDEIQIYGRSLTAADAGAIFHAGSGGLGGNTVRGNFIGTDITGDAALHDGAASDLDGASNNLIGGSVAVGDGNVFADSVEVINGSDGNRLFGNNFGVARDGTTGLGNTAAGLVVQDSSNNTIGGDRSSVSNLIGGNGDGVSIENLGSTGNLVQGNYIGVVRDGSTPIANGAAGVIVGGSNNTIGGIGSLGNIIAPGTEVGIEIVGVGATGNVIQGNMIGTNVTGTAAVAGGGIGTGIAIFDADHTTIGGDTPGQGNLISGNAYGIDVESTDASDPTRGAGTAILGNSIGTNRTGDAAISNEQGIFITVSSVRIGDTTGGGNLISGNGIQLSFNTGSGSVVQGNTIGLNATRTAAIIPVGAGLGTYSMVGVVLNFTTDNSIGGTASGARNVIAGNQTNVSILGSSARNLIQGNLIGTDGSGTLAIAGDQEVGIALIDAADNSIGGTTAAARNVISGHSVAGIRLAGGGAVRTTVQGNSIGLDVTGQRAVPNGDGILDNGGSASTIGGTVTGAGNVISGNAGSGIHFVSDVSSSPPVDSESYVLGNMIGTNPAGTAAIPNANDGILIEHTYGIFIGGSDPATPGTGRNVISGNLGAGVAETGYLPSSTPFMIFGNNIGTDVSGTADLGNGGAGVLVTDSAGGVIGSKDYPALRNIIAYNGKSTVDGGVFLSNAKGTVVETNAMFLNYGPGISNSALVNTPTIQSIDQTGGTLSVSLTYQTLDAGDYWFSIYAVGTADADGHGEGKTYLGGFLKTLPANTLETISPDVPFTLHAALPTHAVLTATATDTPGDGSAAGTTGFGANIGGDQPPTANAGPDRVGLEGTPIRFDGSGSTDLDGDALTYTWLFKDSGGTTVGTATGPRPEFVFPSAGNDTATLTVDDGFGGTNTAGPIDVLVQNSPPKLVSNVLSLSQQYANGGGAVASVGNVIAIGSSGATTSGSIDLYNGTTGALLKTIAAPSPAVGDLFGAALAAVGTDRLLVGAPGVNGGAGASYLIDLNPASPTFGAIKTTFASVGGGFGSSVAAVGPLVAVGAPNYGGGAGEVAMFDPVTGTMTNLIAVPNGIGNASPHFGQSVASLGDELIVGAPTDNTAGPAAGAVYLFDTATNQTLQTFLNPSPSYSDSPDLFGASVAGIGTDRVVVGAPWEDSRGANSGAAYLFDATTSKLSVAFSPALTIGAQFGSSIAIDGLTALVGAPGSIVVAGGTQPGAGTAFLIDADPTSPTYGSALGSVSDPSATTGEHFGASVAFTTDGRALVGSASGGVSVYRQNVTLGIFSQALAEGGATDLSGSFTDLGTGQAHTLTVTWGDGSANTVVVMPAGATVFDATLYPGLSHVYPQDASVAFPIGLTVTDSAGGTDLATGSVNVRNVAPTFVTPNTDGQMDEGSFYQLGGSVVDPGTLDTHVVTIDWGDRTPVTVVNLAAGQSFPTQSHPYADNLAGDAPYTIHIGVTDGAGASNSYDLHEVVHNVAPTLKDLALTASSIDEGDTVTLTGGWSDPGTLDTHTVHVVWGDDTSDTIPAPPHVFGSGVSTFSIDHHYLNNPIGVVDLPLVVSVTDDDGGVGTTGGAGQPAAPALAIHDVAPKVSVSVDTSAALIDPTVLKVVATVNDPGLADVASPGGYQWQVEGIDGGGGSTVLLTFAESAGFGPDLSFTYPTGPSYVKYVVTLVVTDRDGVTGTDRAAVLNVSGTNVVATFTDADFMTVGGPVNSGVILATGTGTINAALVTFPLVIKGSSGGSTAGFDIIGGSGDDLIVGDGATQFIDGALGNDTIVSNHGDDTIVTGGGNNTVFFVPGSSPTLIAPDDPDNVNTIDLSMVDSPDTAGGANQGVKIDLTRTSAGQPVTQQVDSSNFLSLQGTFRQVIGSQFNDTLIGTGGDDTLNGGGGSNLLVAGDGNSSLIGGTGGKNTILAGSGNDVIFGGDGGYDSIVGASGNTTMTGGTGTSTITGGTGNATIQAGGGYNTIVAGAGNSTIYGGDGGHDSITGGTGNTTITAGDGGSTMTGGQGNSTVYGGTGGYNTIISGGGNDVIFGGDGGYDSIVGGQSGTTMTGGTGNTTMIGGGGNTSIVAGGGNNTIIAGGGNDVIFGGDGGYDSIVGGTGGSTVTAGTGNSTVTGGDGGSTMTAGSGNSTVYGGSGGFNTIIAGGGNDVIFGGTGGYDSIVGGSGGTTTTGANGNSTVTAATGGTTIYGGGYSSVPGADGTAPVTTYGGGGNNTIISGGGNDLIFGGTGGYDSIISGSGNSTVTGGTGDTTMTGGGGNNTIVSGGGNNTIISGGGNDVIFGGDGGYDSIISGSGNSTVTSGTGNTTVTAGSGNSTVYGGDGGYTRSSPAAETTSSSVGTADTTRSSAAPATAPSPEATAPRP